MLILLISIRLVIYDAIACGIESCAVLGMRSMFYHFAPFLVAFDPDSTLHWALDIAGASHASAREEVEQTPRLLADHHLVEGTSHTNPKRERGMPQVSWGATPAPSLTLRVGMKDDSSRGAGSAQAGFPGGVQREVSHRLLDRASQRHIRLVASGNAPAY